jgi:hypothetical protein
MSKRLDLDNNRYAKCKFHTSNKTKRITYIAGRGLGKESALANHRSLEQKNSVWRVQLQVRVTYPLCLYPNSYTWV